AECSFHYDHWGEIFRTALDRGYQIVTLADWFAGRYDPARKVLVNRMDVDDHIERLWIMRDILAGLGVRASIFFRLHAQAYNLLFFDHVNLVRALAADGHEIGLHSEIEDLSHICRLEAEQALRAEIALFGDLLGAPVRGVASHGDITPYNNLDFWKDHTPADFGLLYEAYDRPLWTGSRYVSDSEYTRWKAYEGGELRQGDRRCACEHLREGASPIYLLTHTCSWYRRHIHEQCVYDS
ncbi:MAG: hypothetical protein AB7D57_03085, partial [Desulfovibrionaceae bacterium]